MEAACREKGGLIGVDAACADVAASMLTDGDGGVVHS
jgi:hypothetical protein